MSISSRPKILLLITNLGLGGAQRVFYDHSTALSQKYEVIEAVFDKAEAPDLYPSGNRLVSLDVKWKKGILNKLKNFYLRCKRLKELVQNERIDICISHMDGANWVNVLSYSAAKKILVVHGTVLHDHNRKGWFQFFRTKFLIPFVYNKAASTITVSDAIAYELKQKCHVKNVQSIPNFFDIDFIRIKANEQLNLNERELFTGQSVLINTGRLAEQKKQRYLFPVLKCVQSVFPQVKLVFLGDGELRNELIAAAKENGLLTYDVWGAQHFHSNYDVYFLGYSDNPYKYLKHSLLFLFPSGWEGFPMALCEAMAIGVPVLSADCPTGPRQILNPADSRLNKYDLTVVEWASYGVLLPLFDKPSFEEAWATAIIDLLKDEHKYTSLIKIASTRISDFKKEKVLKQWIQLIDQHINKV